MGNAVHTKIKISRKRERKMVTGVTNETSATLPEEEPPGLCAATDKADTEPPGKSVSAGRSYFAHVPQVDWDNWKWHFRNRITTVDALARYIPLSSREETRLKLVTRRYPLSITPYYLSLIDPHNPNDPVRKQAVPSILEITMGSVGSEDPLEEKRDSVVPGLVHRYPDRVLMVLTDICPMLCRHCTRKREWRRGGWVRSPAQVETMLDYIRRHEEVRDVIISGGDPLTLSTHYLEEIISSLRKIGHVEIIRIGTRFPVVLPQRIDDELCAMLSKYSPIWLNTHFNHAREITPEAARACDRLLRSGVPVNNQSVLLKGINDTVEVQKKLCHELLRIKVRPYYLFQCDEVQGTEHLRTPVEVGIKIIEGLRGHTSGLAVPTFVVDLPEGGGKVPLQANYVLSQTKGELIVRNYKGRVFRYRNPKASARQGLARVTAARPVESVTVTDADNQTANQREGVRDEDRVIV
jgi:lysine 2,3-aminomutase